MQNKKEEQLQKLAVASSVAGGVEAASLAVSFGGLFGEFFHSSVGSAITSIGSQVLYPLIMAAAAAETILGWVRVDIDRNKQNKVKKRNVVNAGISTTAFAGFSTALIGLLVAAPLFGQAAAIIFMSIIGARALYNFGAGIYYKYQASKMYHDAKIEKYNSRGNQHIKNGVFGLIAFAAVTAVFLLGYTVAAPVGIALNAFFTAMAVVGVVTGIKKLMDVRKKSQPLLSSDDESENNVKPVPVRRTVSAPIMTSKNHSRQESVTGVLRSPGRNSVINIGKEFGQYAGVSNDETRQAVSARRN